MVSTLDFNEPVEALFFSCGQSSFMQYSLRTLMIVMTCVCVVCFVLFVLRPSWSSLVQLWPLGCYLLALSFVVITVQRER